MLSIGALNNGIVLDHIEAGKAMEIYRYLDLDNLDCGIAIIKNAQSNKMERKDIIKIDGGLDLVDLDVLGYIDCNITVNIIKCSNPRCITSSETNLDQIFYLADASHHTYRCKYCDEKAK